MVLIDIKDAYFHIPVSSEFQKYLQFRWKGSIYCFKGMPFGISSAPRIFTKVMKVVLSKLRMKGIRIVSYIDDLLLMARSKEECYQHLWKTLTLLTELGWLINWEKSKLKPAQTQKFLGLIIDSYNMSFRIPRDKLRGLQKDIKETLQAGKRKEWITVRKFARTIGKIMAVELAVLPTCLKTWGLIKCKNQSLSLGWEGKIQLAEQAVQDLECLQPKETC